MAFDTQSAEDRAAAHWPDTIGGVLAYAVHRFGDRPAVYFEGEWSTFTSLDEASSRFADSLSRQGVGGGSRVVMHLPNSLEWIVAYFGVAKTGAVVVPLDAMLTPEEVAFILQDSGSTVLITGLEDRDAIERIRAVAPLSLLVLSSEAASIDGGVRQADLVTHGASGFQPAPSEALELSTIQYTSGTTGNPKGAMLSHRTVLASAGIVVDAHDRTAADTVLSALPCTHVYGNNILLGTMLVGSRLILLRRFDAEAALSGIAAHKATIFEGVPTMYYRILAHSRLGQHDVSSLTRCTVGGQKILVEKIASVEQVLGCPLIELWGMSELGGTAITHPLGQPSPAGSIGRPFAGMEARLADLLWGAADQIGELCLRGPLVMQGYLNRPEATAATIDSTGWLRTGDLARIDEDGNIFIEGRSKEMVITAGYNIYPTEVEGAIAQHPAVAMVAVGKSPDPEKGEIPVAYVVLKPGHKALAGEIEQAARDRLAPYKAPRRVVFVEDLPKTGSGKIMRHRLDEAKPVVPLVPAADAPPQYKYVRTEVADGVGSVVMHGPKGINALNEELILEIVDALHRFDRDPEIRCMILRAGTLKYFSVGADIDEMSQRGFSAAMDEDFFTVGWAKIAQCRKPLIAAVSGFALGGGCELALMCDIIIASETAEFGLPEVRLGIFPGAGGTQRLTRQIGKSRAMEMILTGEVRLTAAEALSLGLAARVVPAEQLVEAANALAQKIAANSTLTVRMAKESVNRAYESSLAEGLLFERRLFYATLATADKAEGTKAFLEKRPPYFTDR